MRSRAFSFIEMLVVLVIIAIACTMAIPLVTHNKHLQEQRRVEQRLQAIIAYAAAEAIVRGETVAVCQSEGGRWSDGQIVIADQTILRVYPPVFGDLEWKGFLAQDCVRFSPIGISEGSNGRFQYCYFGHGFLLWVNQIGRVRVQEIDCPTSVKKIY